MSKTDKFFRFYFKWVHRIMIVSGYINGLLWWINYILRHFHS